MTPELPSFRIAQNSDDFICSYCRFPDDVRLVTCIYKGDHMGWMLCPECLRMAEFAWRVVGFKVTLEKDDALTPGEVTNLRLYLGKVHAVGRALEKVASGMRGGRSD